MLPLPDDKLFTNAFVDVVLPTKAQIFSRTGQRAVSPNGIYTRDDVASFSRSQTEQMEDFATAAESYEPPKSEE